MAEMKYAPEAMYDGTREREGKGERKTIAVLQLQNLEVINKYKPTN